MDSNRDEARLFLDALHREGVLLAIIPTAGRWVGICVDKAERYWIVEGVVTTPDSVDCDGLQAKDHCFKPSYDEALSVFRRWWERDFAGVPCGGGGGPCLVT